MWLMGWGAPPPHGEEVAVHVEGAEGIWEISVPFAQFSSEPKTALKNKIYF